MLGRQAPPASRVIRLLVLWLAAIAVALWPGGGVGTALASTAATVAAPDHGIPLSDSGSGPLGRDHFRLKVARSFLYGEQLGIALGGAIEMTEGIAEVAAGMSGGGASLALAGTGLGMPLAWAGATASTAAVAAGGAHMAEAGYKIGSAALAMAGLVRGGGGSLSRPSPLKTGEFRAGELDIHFEKHAAEWGAGNITKTSYLNRARNLLESAPGGDILGHTRPSGDILRYNVRTNEFAVGTADGTIRTMFRPAEGMNYWLKQVGGQ